MSDQIISLEPLKKDVDEFLYEYQQVNINTAEDYTQAGDILKMVQQRVKKVEAKRKEYTDPLEQSKKRIIADFKQITEPLEQFVEEIKKKMVEWYRLDQKRRDDEQKRIEAEAIKQAQDEKKLEVVVPVVNEVKKTHHGESSTTTVKKIWTFKIIDPEKVPIGYRTIDEKLIRGAIKEGVRKIDGVEIYQDDSLSIR